jgi:hypothetical protein
VNYRVGTNCGLSDGIFGNNPNPLALCPLGFKLGFIETAEEFDYSLKKNAK